MRDDILFSHSIQGASHIVSNKICQDSSGKYSDDDMCIIIVADGHGSEDFPRTDKGSLFLVKCAIDSIITFVRGVKENIILLDDQNYFDYLHDLTKNILLHWNDLVTDDLIQNPFTEKDLEKVSEKYRHRYTEQLSAYGHNAYGTTMLAVCLTEEYWFGIQIGDGKCVTFSKEGIACEPIPSDSSFADSNDGSVASICDSNAIEEFRYCFGMKDEIPAAVFIGTDGVDNSFPTDRLYDFYASVMQIVISSSEDRMKKDLIAYLPKISQKGSRDDISVAFCLRRKAYPEAWALFKNKELNQKKDIIAKEIETIQHKPKYEDQFTISSLDIQEEIQIIEKQLIKQKELLQSISKNAVVNQTLGKARDSLTELKRSKLDTEADSEDLYTDNVIQSVIETFRNMNFRNYVDTLIKILNNGTKKFDTEDYLRCQAKVTQLQFELEKLKNKQDEQEKTKKQSEKIKEQREKKVAEFNEIIKQISEVNEIASKAGVFITPLSEKKHTDKYIDDDLDISESDSGDTSDIIEMISKNIESENVDLETSKECGKCMNDNGICDHDYSDNGICDHDYSDNDNSKLNSDNEE